MNKTIRVAELKVWANLQLTRTDDFANNSGFKDGICVMLEHVLHLSGNYKGYANLYWLEQGCNEWEQAGKPEQFPYKDKFIYGSPTSKYKGDKYARHYH